MRTMFISILLLNTSVCISQLRFAVVNGTNNSLKVTSTLDSAIKIAVNGDYIYMPGGTFPGTTIDKKVFMFGTGIILIQQQAQDRRLLRELSTLPVLLPGGN